MRDTNDEPILGAILRLSRFAVLTFLLQNAYHLNDAFFLGRHSPDSANAMGLFMIVMIANFGFILVLARGTQSLVGRRFGAGNREGASLALAQGLGLAMRVVVPLAALQWIFAPEIVRFMGGEGEVVDVAASYLRTIFLFMPFLFASPVIDFAFQGTGDTATPFRLQLVAVCVNFVLNALLVLDPETFRQTFGVSLPCAGLGVMGAAIATGTSRAVSSSLGFLLLIRREKWTALARPDAYPLDRRIVNEILRVGLPAGSSTFLYALVAMGVMQVITKVGGPNAPGAFGIGFRGVESVSFMMVLGLGVGTGTVVAHAVGAGNFARARRAGHVGTLVGVVAMSLTMTAFLLFPRELAGFYTRDEAILAIAATYIATMAFCQIPQALEMIYADAMAGAGSAARTVLISIPGNVLRIPLAWFLAVHLDLGLMGVWYAILTSAAVKGMGIAALYVSGKWEKAMHVGRRVLDAA